MKRFALLAFVVMLVISCDTKKKENTDEYPNIIHIFADDLGYGDLGCFGAQDIKTPHIDRLASEGIQFTSFYSASSVCSPSRAGLMTGRMPQRMGVNAVFFPESFTGMPSEEITLAELLKDAGYSTAMVGKWHLGHHYKYLPLQQGFDSYFGIPYSNDMESVVYMRGNDVVEFKVDQQYITKTFTEEALDFIDKQTDTPFFLYLAHSMPHVPIYASEDFLGTSERGLYGDVIQELDWSVGQIINKLDALQKLDNTLIIFSSDNGPWLVMEDHGGSPGVLREGKMFTFEGGIRVPTVAMWKNKIPAGQVYEEMASQLDWFPTFASITGQDLPSDRGIDGKDITKVLLGTGSREQDNYLYFDYEKLEGYRKGNWKVKLPFNGFKGAPWKSAVAAHDTLLFNLSTDPGENNNVYKEYKELAKELIGEMKTEAKKMEPLPPSLFIRSGADNSHFDYLKKKHAKTEANNK